VIKESTLEKEKIIARGDAAIALMNSDTFNLVTKELSESYVDSFMTSKPEDRKEREIAYYKNVALQDILGLLLSWATLRDQALIELENYDNE
jgi:hypothetical protein